MQNKQTSKKEIEELYLSGLKKFQLDYLNNWYTNNGFNRYTQKSLICFLRDHYWKVVIHKKKHYYSFVNDDKGVEVICVITEGECHPDFAVKDTLIEALWECVEFLLNARTWLFKFLSEEKLLKMYPYNRKKYLSQLNSLDGK